MPSLFQKKVSLKSKGYSIKNVMALGLLLCSIMVPALTQAAMLENPADNVLYSGINVISGWKCDTKGALTVRFNGGKPIPLVYGSQRDDTRPVCGDADNGFVAIWNWAILGDGTHTAVVYDNDVEFDRSTFDIATTGEEFVSGVSAQGWVEDFPSPGERTRLQWNQGTQHFELAEVSGATAGGECDLDTDHLRLTNGADGYAWEQGVYALRIQPEADYVAAWCVAQGGLVEFSLRDGTRADCVLPDYAVEGDFANKWYEGIGQAAHYAHLLQKRPGVLLILEQPNDCRYLARMCAVLTGLRFQEQLLTVWTTGPVSCQPGK